MIVATAGHIDHGKTLLVKALTGVDADRLPEEKARGMTIDLGYAYAPLPDGQVLGFIDVPGHERFVRNMLAGVTGIDFALLVVAADDGPMPQTREHAAILDLLDIGQAAVALTKTDRADAGRVAAVTAEIAGLLAPTGLAGAPIFPVSSVTGEGIAALRAHLAAVAKAGSGGPASGSGFRLAIDRCFTIAGAGIVVTGTVFAGRVKVQDELVLSPTAVPVRVRGIHAQNQPAEQGTVGERCAINIAGPQLDKDRVKRGDWLLDPRLHAPTDRLDVRLRVLAGESRPLRHWLPVHLHLGAIDVTARLAPLEDRGIAPGRSALAQIVLDRPIGALAGDRFVLRDQAATRTIGGGRIIDPFPPKRGRSRPDRLQALAALSEPDDAKALSDLIACTENGCNLDSFARARNRSADRVRALAGQSGAIVEDTPDGSMAVSAKQAQIIGDRAFAAITAHHTESPEALGPDEGSLHRKLAPRLAAELFAAILRGAIAAGRLAKTGVYLHRPSHRPELAAADRPLWQAVQRQLAMGGTRPPALRDLAQALNTAEEDVNGLLARAHRLGLVVQVTRRRYFIADAIVVLAGVAETLARETEDGTFTTAAYRDASGIGRNLTVDMLEYFDRIGFTRRVDDTHRRILRYAKTLFGGGASAT
ncbi:MAG: selenocysteine-specific translation elongation factor [Alphaproteobacteria bacterium]